MPPDFATGLSDGVLIALIGGISAALGGGFTAINAHFKQKSDKAISEAEYAHRKMQAADEAFKDLRESQQNQIDELHARADAQWEEIVKLRSEKHIYELVRITLLEVLLAYPNPPGPPKISAIVAQAIGWEADTIGTAPKPSIE